MSKMRLGMHEAKWDIWNGTRTWDQAQGMTQHSTRAWSQAQGMTQRAGMGVKHKA